MARKPKAVKPEPIKYHCEFCKKDFQRENSLIVHTCEQKRRWLWKDEKYSQMGFRAFQVFYETSMRSKKPKTFEDFMKSQYYTSFIKFGKYLTEINALEPMGFVDFLIRTQVKLFKWEDPKIYEIWVRELGKKEDPDRALERNILLMEQWARENETEWTEFFRQVNPQVATNYIRKGRLSPWLLFTVGEDLIDRLSDEQLGLVQDIIDPNFWATKFSKNEDAVKSIKHVLREAGV